MLRIGDIGEKRLIERLVKNLPSRPDVRVGPGDDCAVVSVARGAHDFLLTSDAVVQGVHFTRQDEPRRVGHKALGRVLSDMAAMGGEPLWALVNVEAPPSVPCVCLDGIYAGIAALARRFSVAVVGGDVTAGRNLALHVFGVGRVPRHTAILRSGASAGDRVYVTGRLGGSLKGKHLRFTPRLGEGRWLRQGRWASAMIDVSDGLATDLRRLMSRSGVGVELNAADIPLSAAARDGAAPSAANPPSPGRLWRTGGALARSDAGKRAALRRALTDGEDFELLFTVPPGKAARLEARWKSRFPLPLTAIGTVTRHRDRLILLDESGGAKKLQEIGYEHFSKSQ